MMIALRRSSFRLTHAAVAAAVLITPLAVFGAANAVSQRDAEQFLQKVAIIERNGSSTQPARLSTVITEAELNSFLRLRAAEELPAGVSEPHISILGDRRISGRAIVDLDAVRRERSTGGWLDPTAYLTGRLPVTATGLLHTHEGIGRFELESVEISGVMVPNALLQELVSYYSRTPEQPKGVSLDDPFELPSAIREIEIGRGRAVVVQ